VSPALDAVVLHALAKDKFERFQTAAEFRDDLETAAAGSVPPRKAVANDFNATLFGANPAATAGSEAALRQLNARADERAVRTQSRPPVAWIWVGIASLAVILVAVVFWVIPLPPSTIGDGLSVRVPNIVGEQYDAGATKLTDLKLVPSRLTLPSDTVAKGDIISTDPAADSRVPRNQAVKVYVSDGKNPTTIPSVNNLSEDQAKAALTERKLHYGKSTPEHSATLAAGTVIRSTPEANSAAHEGDIVDLVISDGLINIPDVGGQAIADANTLLQPLGLTINTVPDASCAGGKVTAQSLKGDNQPQHSSITLTYCSK